jgi:ankyrin repeat protein
MKSHLLLTTIAAVVLVGCGDPEAEANKLFTEASQLVKNADAITEPYSLEAYNKRKAAVEVLEKIPVQYPQSSLSVKISEGDFKIQNQSIDEIREKMKPDISIYEAAQAGNIEAVKQHIAASTDVNAKVNGWRWTPLHLAADRGHKEIVKLLIASGVDVNAKGDDGGTPLHKAATKGRKEVAELLIAEGADVNAAIEVGVFEGDTPLDWSAKRHPETAALLRKHGGKITKAPDIPLLEAATDGNIEAAKEAIAAGADVNAKMGGGTPLHWAAQFGHKKIIELLIAKGADVNAMSDRFGGKDKTALDWAVDQDQTETADLLRKHGGKTGEELKAEGK